MNTSPQIMDDPEAMDEVLHRVLREPASDWAQQSIDWLVTNFNMSEDQARATLGLV